MESSQSSFSFDQNNATSSMSGNFKEEEKSKPNFQQSLGSQAFFDDAPLPESEPSLGSRVFFDGFQYPGLEEPALYDEINGSVGYGNEPEPSPEPLQGGAKLTKKRKSQAWDSKPLENRRKSHNFNNSKALDIRRKTMYCTTEKPSISHYSFSKSFVEESPRFENNSFYNSGSNNPNNRMNREGVRGMGGQNPFTSGLRERVPSGSNGSNGLEIKEPTDFIYDGTMFPLEPPSSDLANLFIGSEKEGGVQPVRKVLLKRRKSEDWDSRPLELLEKEKALENERKAQLYDNLERSKQLPNGNISNVGASAFASQQFKGPGGSQGFQQMRTGSVPYNSMVAPNHKNSTKPQVAFDFGEDSKQRRTKWTSEEVHTLWKGIMLHGNNWSIIKDSLPSRTYYQIKDKGRRILYNQGWKTGRTKKDAGGASDDAKIIAQGILNRR